MIRWRHPPTLTLYYLYYTKYNYACVSLKSNRWFINFFFWLVTSYLIVSRTGIAYLKYEY